ncbi:cytokinin hydroxylase-like [Amaranthus tricolor]|uniref:cytokinin hydroxylase-like n=1 Tax=Amaranthus tricolor TaxID=29722 RepID=UPI00258AA9B2|nr:cytokinin hydroxylase-like [Amaranthus tricolor]
MTIVRLLYGYLFFFLLWKLLYALFLSPIFALQKLRKNGLKGPRPIFPLGNLIDIKKKLKETKSLYYPSSRENISHDIHSSSLPHFAQWQKLYGKVFVYWMGVEPFLYIADPEFLKQMNGCVMAKDWGKPKAFIRDRIPLFGEYGLTMIEGEDWARHRHIATPAFSSTSLKGMANLIAESTTKVIRNWTTRIGMSNKLELEMEREVSTLAGEIMAKTNLGINGELGHILFEKLRALQINLFKHSRYLGVPYGHFLKLGRTLEAKKLGKEIDDIIISIINSRKKVISEEKKNDLLGLLLESEEYVNGKNVGKLSTREIIDECKTFFLGGHDTVALTLTWTLMLLAMYPNWQDELRQEIKEVIGEKDNLDFTMLPKLKKMGWVMNEVLRLYPSAPNTQRQARSDIQVGDVVIPNGTNVWIDVVSMHHDRGLWGDDVNEFKPERFDGDLYGGCKHKMAYLPFGFGGRMCLGKNFAIMEYKIVTASILRHFSFSISPSYRHFPMHFFTFRPDTGMPLIVEPL